MNRPDRNGFVGVFDSGVGGISILRELVSKLERESFVYFGDSAYAPYGDKTEEEVRQRSCQIAQSLIDEGAKALVIACNTATSAAAATLREAFPAIPIVGIEPALKPAALAPDHDRILVMATRTTLDLDKFHALARAYGSESTIITQACPGLADLIEVEDPNGPEVRALLEKLIGKHADMNIDSVVLGCTHYPFAKQAIEQVLGPVAFYDGAVGTAQQLCRRLQEEDLCAPDGQCGSVDMRSSEPGPQVLDRYWRLFESR